MKIPSPLFVSFYFHFLDDCNSPDHMKLFIHSSAAPYQTLSPGSKQTYANISELFFHLLLDKGKPLMILIYKFKRAPLVVVGMLFAPGRRLIRIGMTRIIMTLMILHSNVTIYA
jgi:hypothetical protein